MPKPPKLDHDFTEHPVRSETVFQGQMLHVKRDEVRLPDGHTATREYIRHPGAVVIVPMLDAETVLLEYQFRYPLARHFYEMPAGKVERGEDELATAQRELIEETGYEAGRWDHLTTLHPCIGYADEKIEIYLARDLHFIGHQRDHGEFLETLPVKIEDGLRWVRDGTISDTKTIIGFFWLKVWGAG